MRSDFQWVSFDVQSRPSMISNEIGVLFYALDIPNRKEGDYDKC